MAEIMVIALLFVISAIGNIFLLTLYASYRKCSTDGRVLDYYMNKVSKLERNENSIQQIMNNDYNLAKQSKALMLKGDIKEAEKRLDLIGTYNIGRV